MILLTPNMRGSRHCPAAVLLFGAGMVGSAISTALQQTGSMAAESLMLEWNGDSFASQLSAIESRAIELLEQVDTESAGTRGFQFLWCAGQAGFQSSDQDTRRELQSFEQVMSCMERLADRFPDLPATMALMSSAGGLFEGQRGVSVETVPDPSRPYGRLKLQQEQRLLGSPARIRRKIFRLTSVYGYVRRHQRRGLIPTLVANGLCQRVSQITGYSTTIRDYVWIEDIAEYVVRTLLDNDGADSSVEVLASGKPSSILEIQQIVENAIGRPLYLRFTPDATNGVTMSFDPSLFPAGWRPSELTTNVRKIAVDAMARQTAFVES